MSRSFYFLSLVPFVLAAIFSQGFIHPDEHYQILEFLNLKMSNWTDPSIFNWDFHEKIRPWFQVSIYYSLFKFLPAINPFNMALIIRIFNGLLGWLSIFLVSRLFFDKDSKKKLFFVSMVWFVPFFFVRTNSESLSTS